MTDGLQLRWLNKFTLVSMKLNGAPLGSLFGQGDNEVAWQNLKTY